MGRWGGILRKKNNTLQDSLEKSLPIVVMVQLPEWPSTSDQLRGIVTGSKLALLAAGQATESETRC